MTATDGSIIGYSCIDGHYICCGVYIYARVCDSVLCTFRILDGLIVGNTVFGRVLSTQYLRVKYAQVKLMHTVILPVIITGRQYRVHRGISDGCFLYIQLHVSGDNTAALNVLYPYQDRLVGLYLV